MTSVWKRLQRVGKKASKFQFTASYQSLTVECVRGGRWQPNKLVVVWTRRKRRKLAKPMPWQPGISNPFRGIIVWPEPDPVDITVTLYKDSKPDSQFEDKEWTFVIEDESLTGGRKPIARGAINMVDYVSIESRTFDVTLTLKVASKKLVSASLEFNLTCVLIKEGMATDDDMISIGSMLSLGDSYYLDDNDDDMEVVPSPRLRHKRNLAQGQGKVSGITVTKLQEAEDVRTRSPAASPVPSKKRSRIRSKSALGENTKTLISDLQNEEGMKRLSTGSDVSVEDGAQESSKDRNKMESELIKWARSCTKGYRGVKVKDMTTSWRNGLAFCAVLHHFHPDQIDFTSLNPENIKENNRLAFTAFEKLGITRLLDPTQMMFSPIPDKLSVMTYVFQIKTHFTRSQPLPPSPLSLVSSSTTRRLLPAAPQVIVTADDEESKDPDDNHEADIDNSVSKESAAQESEEGYNPFLGKEEPVNDIDATPEQPADPPATSLGDSKERGTTSEQDSESKSLTTTEENKNTLQEAAGKRNDVLVKSNMKPPPKPPRLHDITNTSSSVDASPKTRDTVDDKDKTETKGYNPFDDDEKEEVAVSKESDSSSKSSKGYNPFDDDDNDDGEVDVVYEDTQKKLNDTETKHGYNPFDDGNDDAEDTIQTEKTVDQKTAKKPSGVVKRRVSYPHDFNPFEHDDDLESTEADESSKRTEANEGKGKDTSSGSTEKSYNPFDDDEDDDESISGDVGAIDSGQVEISTRKSSAESGSAVTSVTESSLLKPVETHKKRRAPPPPAARSSDNPWTQRLPDDATPRRRRVTKPTTPGTAELASPQTSPAKKGPKRAAPPPPRRPPLIPSFDEWRSGESTDRAATGNNDRPAASSRAESSPSRKRSPATDEVDGKSASSGSKSPGTAHKVPSSDGANQADIKLLARQVLMDARKKAGASGALPRQRVAEIAKTATDKATTGSTRSEAGTQEKPKVDEQDAIRKKEALKQRKEELQKRKKATEKAHMMLQNAIARDKAQKATNSQEQTKTEKKDQEVVSDAPNSDATSNDQKPVGNKNLQHRPLKLKDKENESQKRKLSTEKDANKSPTDKAGFKESDELQRIRKILNQGKQEKKPSTSENVDQGTDTTQARSTGALEEGNRKMSGSKSSNFPAVNGVKGSASPTPATRPKSRGPNAGLRDYVQSRKMNFDDVFEVPPVQRTQQSDEQGNAETGKGGTTEGPPKNGDSIIDGKDSEDLTLEFQDTSDYVRQELKVLEEQQEALDKVGEKLETELRRAMECKGCEDEQEKLMQDWFLLVNKKNELVRRQGELNLLVQERFPFMRKGFKFLKQVESSKNEQDLERSHNMLQRELRALFEMEDYQKTDEQREREMELIQQLVSVVNKRDQLVQFEDSQLQQAEKDALHVEEVINSARMPKDKNAECVLQ